MEFDVMSGVTRIVVEPDTIITDFNLSDDVRKAKAQMLGKIKKNGLSEYKLTDIPFLVKNSDVVVLLGYDELTLPYISSIEEVFINITNPEHYKKIHIWNDKTGMPYAYWDYSSKRLFSSSLSSHYKKEFWGYSMREMQDQSLIRVFAIAWARLHNFDDFSERIKAIQAVKNNNQDYYCMVISSLSRPEVKDKGCNLGVIVTSPIITSKYEGANIYLHGNVRDVTDALFDIEIDSNFGILPIRLSTSHYERDEFTVSILHRHPDTENILYNAFKKHNLNILEPNITN